MAYFYEMMTSDGQWSKEFFLKWNNCIHFPDEQEGLGDNIFLWGGLKSINSRKLIEWEGFFRSIQKEIKKNYEEEEFENVEIILYGERRDIIIYFIDEKTIKHKMLVDEHPHGEFGRDHR